MSDPLSIAGLSIAIFDQLLKLGERTAQLISDARSFNEDTELYTTKIIDENSRTRQLRHILFESSTVYDGACLFENFDEDVQQQIKVFLRRGVHMLQEALELLESRNGDAESQKRPSLTSSLSSISLLSSHSPKEPRSPSPRSFRNFSRKSINLIRWSLQDKKRTEEIITEYSDLNCRIHENVKLWCLADSLKVNKNQHLNRLQHDESSRQLGYDVDASLKIKTAGGDQDDISFELGSAWLGSLRSATPVEERFALVQQDGKPFLMEYRRNDGTTHAGVLDQRTSRKINDLASLLSQPKETAFCIPRCIGWTYMPTKDSIAFLFDIPPGHNPSPTSLFQLLDMKNVKLNLGQRFRLTLALARCIAQLQLVKWVHESFRSENILFFPPSSVGASIASKSESDDDTTRINYADPYVLGFESTRPEIDFSTGFADVCIDRDVYRHPERQGKPGQYFTRIHDIYALGVVLLEIGLWQRAITLEKNQFRTARDPFVIKAQLLKQAQRRLGDKMGEKYQQVVVACLTGEFGVDHRDDLGLQQAFRTKVVAVLERIVEYI